MDFVGEIIEHEIEPPSEPTPFNAPTGFPDPQQVSKVSRWKQKQSKSPKSELPPQDEPTTELTEAQKLIKRTVKEWPRCQKVKYCRKGKKF